VSSDALSPEQEAQLMGELLRDRVSVDPEKKRPVVDLAALGLVNSAWRNSPVEDWHADGRLSDADMLRINSESSGWLQTLKGQSRSVTQGRSPMYIGRHGRKV
jgi:hypothetical protein